MQIRIKTNVSIPEIPSEVELQAGKLGDLLLSIFTRTHFAQEIIDSKTGQLKFDGIFELRLNGVPYYTLTKGLDMEMKDGDIVELSLILLGGG
jgi:hypothetical protein